MTPTITKEQMLEFRHLTKQEAAKELNISSSNMYRLISRYDLSDSFYKDHKWHNITKADVLRYKGKSVTTAANLLGVGIESLNSAIKHFPSADFFCECDKTVISHEVEVTENEHGQPYYVEEYIIAFKAARNRTPVLKEVSKNLWTIDGQVGKYRYGQLLKMAENLRIVRL